MDDFNWLEPAVFDWLSGEAPTVEKSKDNIPDAFLHVQQSVKQQMIDKRKREKVEAILTMLPQKGEAFHIVSNGCFDYWNFIPHICNLIKEKNIEFYGSTWTINYSNVQSLLGLYDAGILRNISIITGTYFKQREAAVYNNLLIGIQSRGQRFACFENHAKVTLIHHGEYWLSIEGSANYTANPRLEQYVISNDEGLYRFHRGWMEDTFNGT